MTATRDLFARHALRCTRQREAIYHALASTDTHPTAEELFVLVRRADPSVSLATVYNTLEAFVRRGLARRLTGVPGERPGGAAPARYDADTRDHIHFVAADGRVRDVPSDLSRRLVECLPPDLVDELERRMGVRVDRVRIELAGRSTPGSAC
jgi:Fe2+ or Zn2+ uptake regulation protein